MEEHEDAKDSDTGDTTAVPETAAAALTRAELHEAANDEVIIKQQQRET